MLSEREPLGTLGECQTPTPPLRLGKQVTGGHYTWIASAATNGVANSIGAGSRRSESVFENPQCSLVLPVSPHLSYIMYFEFLVNKGRMKYQRRTPHTSCKIRGSTLKKAPRFNAPPRSSSPARILDPLSLPRTLNLCASVFCPVFFDWM